MFLPTTTIVSHNFYFDTRLLQLLGLLQNLVTWKMFYSYILMKFKFRIEHSYLLILFLTFFKTILGVLSIAETKRDVTIIRLFMMPFAYKMTNLIDKYHRMKYVFFYLW